MPTSLQIKQQIDLEITSKLNPSSINPIHVGTNIKNVVDYVDQQISTVAVGPQGPEGLEGPAGPQGVPGAVGPAGLEFRGTWDLDTSYAVDDVVAYLGSSYFCHVEVITTNNIDPVTDTSRWALLASRGADGIQGLTGPQGPQGAQGLPGLDATLNYVETAVNSASSSNAINPLFSDGKITEAFTRVYVTSLTDNYVAISGTDLELGQTFVIENRSILYDLKLRFTNNAKYVFTSFNSSNELVIPSNRILKLTVSSVAGAEKVFIIEDISPRNEFLKTEGSITIPSNGGSPTNFLSLDYLKVYTSNGASNGLNFKGTLNLGESFTISNESSYEFNLTALESQQNIQGVTTFIVAPYTTYKIIKETNSTNSLTAYLIDKNKRKTVSLFSPALNLSSLNASFGNLSVYELNCKVYYLDSGLVQERISDGVWISYNTTLVT